MEYVLSKIDICGLAVELILTDEVAKLLPSEELEDEEIDSFGKYSVPDCKIWLDAGLSPAMLQSQLWHEVEEFVLGYFNVQYDSSNQHDSYMRLSNVKYGVVKTNADLMVGDKLGILYNEWQTKIQD